MAIEQWFKDDVTPPQVVQVSTTTPLPVTQTGAPPSGTSATQVQGPTADDGAITTEKPLMQGAVAMDPDAPSANKTIGRIIRLVCDRVGRLITWQGNKSDPTNDTVSLGASATSAGAMDTQRFINATNTAAAVKAAAGRLLWISGKNRHSADIYLHFYDLATGSVNPIATVPKMSVCILNGSTRELAPIVGISFATAITLVVTTEPNPEAGVATAPATLPVLNIGYK